MMGREPFDAVLIDLGPSLKLAEGTILRMPETRSSLWGRIVVISRGNRDPETLAVIERHNLVHLPQERLVSQLWITLDASS